jgi:chromosome segregation ATPase
MREVKRRKTMKKRTPIAVLAAVAALALPVCALADGTPPAQGPGDRVARIQARIQKAETRIGKVSGKITVLQQKLAAKCSVQPTTPAPAAGDGQASTAPSLADRCARTEARLQKAQDRLQQAQDRLTKLKARLEQWLQNHKSGSSTTASGVSTADQAALAGLQQQLAGAQG